MKYFIITIDTEGDNLWKWHKGDDITTHNVVYLKRFQKLCAQYGYKPVWLSNWEMINDPLFVEFIKESLSKNECELGMHLHAWNTPPEYELNSYSRSGAPYLIEYPLIVMEEKIKAVTEKMQETFGYVPVSHRAGRWAVNNAYFRLLKKYGYKIDCSITPGISWKRSRGQTPEFFGPDYRAEVNAITTREGVTEVPVWTNWSHRFFPHRIPLDKHFMINILKDIYCIVFGRAIMLRPNGNNLRELLYTVKCNLKSDQDYLMFMLHSSELMPGGSPTFPTEQSIEKLYKDLRILFECISKDYKGITLKEYVDSKNDDNKGKRE